MKIGIAARGLSVQSGGAKEYIKRLISSLVEIDTENEYLIFYSKASQLLRLNRSNVTEIVTPFAPNLIWDHLVLPVYLRRHNIDATLFPKCTIPIWAPGKSVVTVYDLAYFFPGLCAYKPVDTFYMRVMIPTSVRRATAVLAISKNTKHDICLMVYKVNPENIHVTHLAAAVDPSALVDVRAKFGLPHHPFIFFAASLSPRKNIERAIKAIATIKDQMPHHFVITGGKAWGPNRIDSAIEEAGLQDRFHRLGHVESCYLHSIYSAAEFYLMPSLYEGFSLTILEAMQAGCPVAASGVSSHPEVVGDAGLLFDPYSIEDMANAILLLAQDKNLRAEYSKLGLERVKQFSWEKCARETLAVIENMGNERIHK